MKKIFLVIIYIAVVLATSLFPQAAGKARLKRVTQWKHDTEPFGNEFISLVDRDNHVIGSFFKSPFRIISAEKIVLFAPYGQGPSDLMNAMAGFIYKGDLAVVETSNKIKVFTKKDGTYIWKETKWLKGSRFPHFVKSGIFFANKLFLAGFAFLNMGKEEVEVGHLKIYDDQGKLLKTLIKKTFKGPSRLYEMRYHVAGYKQGKVFYLPANELKVTVISTNTLEITEEKKIEHPSFYKKMPEGFYIFKNSRGDLSGLKKDLETWATGYSAVTKMFIDGDYLVLQIRTCSERLKKFAFLFYNVEKNFKLENTVYIDDFLLGAKSGKYYCFANGNPGLDDGTDDVIINIYEFVR
jgi:hypothetical protein